MIKLLYITTNLNNSGGLSRVLSVKLNYLINTQNYDIYIINTFGKADNPFYKLNESIKVFSLQDNLTTVKRLFTYKARLTNLINKIQPQIVINCDNGLKGTLLPFIINVKTPMIYERHSNRHIKCNTILEKVKKRLANKIIDISIKKYRCFIILNEDAKKNWKSKNIKIIPNPICIKIPSKQSKLQAKEVLALGRYSVEKGFDILLKIWQKVVFDYPNWVLKIYGEGNSNSHLEKLTKQLKISNNVQFNEPIKNIENAYLNASILLNTSFSEAFGLVILEAMAFGLPVIAFNDALGPKVMIQNNKNGYLIMNYDIDEYSNKVKKLIQNISLRQTLGSNAKNSIENFKIDYVMEQWQVLFQSLL